MSSSHGCIAKGSDQVMLTCDYRAAILADANSSGHLGAGQAATAVAPVEVPHLGRGKPTSSSSSSSSLG
jgi:hypothetical protein